MLKAFIILTNGSRLTVSETIENTSILLEFGGYRVFLSEQDWYELCELRYRLSVTTPKSEPEIKTEKEPNNADESI